MNRRIVIATHHKTGTAWMGATFKAIGAAFDIPWFMVKRDNPEIAAASAPAILLDTHSRWYRVLSATHGQSGDRTMHVIRDPRDVIISAMHYHRVSEESWLHQPQAEFDRATYQQAINALADDRARYLFEMDNSAGLVIRNMAVWDYARDDCFECTYEALASDNDMSVFTAALTHLGFDEAELEECRHAFWRNSLFSGRPQARMKKRQRLQNHIRSGDARQWPAVFDRALAREFLARFGDVLVQLGYERDNAWIDDLPNSAG